MPITSRLHWVILRLRRRRCRHGPTSCRRHPLLHHLRLHGGALKQLSYTGNRTPIAVASADRYYGTTPLAVQLSSNGSYDPDGQQITYSWNFGDGSPVSTQANPAHTFTAPPGVPTEYVVTLTVTDTGNLSAQATLIISVNNTPPNVTITSPVDHALFRRSTKPRST